ncbi:pitrilysin family protein [Geothrix sp. 21YS21S-4]|uniref:M16 family metallopeptidase n=1 Tax=Geothrix sp. 21YS21S-4 TaxID=3068889 RepID=UPI0027BB14A2|nr:insulinase family protein [Geothrix sp. 21YS21S-4]
MRLPVPFLAAACGFVLSAGLTAQERLPDVQERRLANGMRLLVVERRGLSAFHATLVFRGGRAEEPPALAGATDLLARALFGHTYPEDLETAQGPTSVDALLTQEEGLLESLRQERLRQQKDPGFAAQHTGLEENLQKVQAALRARGVSSPLDDLYLARGGRQRAEAGPDALLAETELPADAFAFWCRTEAQRLTALQLSRFAEARTELLGALRNRDSRGAALLRGAALPGHPYGRDLADHLPALEALRRSDLRAWARRACVPRRLTLILVGGAGMEAVLPLIERSFGALPAGADVEDPLPPEIPADLGDRRIQASLGGSARLLAGWRIPPRSHRDHLALRMAAQLLGGGRSGRLPLRLGEQKGLAQEATVRLGGAGARLPGLFVADLVPAEGHTLAELEAALDTEILKLQQEPISTDEWQRAVAQLEVGYLAAQDEPRSLARILGLSWAETGDWRTVGLELQRLRTLAPEAVQTAARVWLQPSHRTVAHLQQGSAGGEDPLEVAATRILKALAVARIEDLAQRERLVAEGLRQLRMLTPAERARTLKLLEAQLPAEKR